MAKAGFPFLFGFYGAKARRDTIKLLKDTGAAGVLLLGRNLETPAQARALVDALEQGVGRRLIVSIDHEGGWVLRFKSGVTALPGNCALGRAADEKLAYAVGRQMALELLPLGIQLNLAPVLDVLTATYNPGIGIRSFGRDPALVGRLGAALIRGLQDHGVAACAKHFPGQGAASADSHVALPTIKLPRREFEREHLKPFGDAVAAGVAAVMTSHVRYPAIDKAVATFSRKITGDVLRKKLGFSGVVISDDLCMGAVSGRMPIQQAAVQALDAGHDLLIIAHDLQAQAESADLMEQALEGGMIDRKSFEASCRRVEALLEPASPKRGRASRAEGLALAREISHIGVTVPRRAETALPLRADDGPLLVVFPDFHEVRERFTFEDGPRGPEAAVARQLRRWGRFKVVRAPVEAKTLPASLKRAVDEAGRVLFFCFEARRFPGQKATLELLNKRAAEKAVLLMIRGGWDLGWADRRMTAVDAGGYRVTQLEAALDEVLA